MFIHNKLDCCYCLTRAEQVLLFRLQPGNNIINTHLFNKHSWPVKDEREAGDFGGLERTVMFMKATGMDVWREMINDELEFKISCFHWRWKRRRAGTESGMTNYGTDVRMELSVAWPTMALMWGRRAGIECSMTSYDTDVRKESWNWVQHDLLWHWCEDGIECGMTNYGADVRKVHRQTVSA